MQERLRPVPGFDGYYEVSDQGYIRSVDRVIWTKAGHRPSHPKRIRSRILKAGAGEYGHLAVVLWKDHISTRVRIHCVVAEVFLGERPPGKYACHRNGNPAVNTYWNLYWGTPTENSDDALFHGTRIQGEQIPWSKLTEQNVMEIRNNVDGRPQSFFVKKFGVSQAQVSRIQNGHQWQFKSVPPIVHLLEQVLQ